MAQNEIFTKINLKTCDIRGDTYNQGISYILFKLDFIDYVHKVWIVAPNISKEARDKQTHDILHFFLKKLNEHLYDSNTDALFDLMTEKVKYMREYTGVTEWVPGETLKIQNLHKVALELYSFQRCRLSKKNTKEIYGRGFKSSANFICKFIENINTTPVKENYIQKIFDDLFYYYKRYKEISDDKEIKDGIIMDMEGTIDLVLEDTSNLILL